MICNWILLFLNQKQYHHKQPPLDSWTGHIIWLIFQLWKLQCNSHIYPNKRMHLCTQLYFVLVWIYHWENLYCCKSFLTQNCLQATWLHSKFSLACRLEIMACLLHLLPKLSYKRNGAECVHTRPMRHIVSTHSLSSCINKCIAVLNINSVLWMYNLTVNTTEISM